MSHHVSLLASKLGSLDAQAPDFAVDVIEQILPTALQIGASDIHVQPRADGWEVLFRVDGVLSVAHRLPGGGPSDPVTRLMVLAGLPTYRSGQPMEGRMQWDDAAGTPLSMRLGVFPTVHGPRAVIRLLRKDNAFDTIESLNLAADQSERLIRMSHLTQGAVLVTGPTGSGKTTTLYAMLRRIAATTPRRSVLTIEDPVESVIDAIGQSELDPGGGMTLASALRSAVRQDSEVLLVSEIRDPETAEAAIQASLTGHLVFSSLHAGDIAAALRRLLQFGIPPYAIRSGIQAIVSQRLIRRLCPHCGGGADAADCPSCAGTRYHGRFAIAQSVTLDGNDPVGEALARSLDAGQTLTEMRRAAEAAGGSDLQAQAWHCVESGLTDAPEIYRVLGQDPTNDAASCVTAGNRLRQES